MRGTPRSHMLCIVSPTGCAGRVGLICCSGRLNCGVPSGLNADLVVPWVEQRQVQFVFYTTGGIGSWQLCPVALSPRGLLMTNNAQALIKITDGGPLCTVKCIGEVSSGESDEKSAWLSHRVGQFCCLGQSMDSRSRRTQDTMEFAGEALPILLGRRPTLQRLNSQSTEAATGTRVIRYHENPRDSHEGIDKLGKRLITPCSFALR